MAEKRMFTTKIIDSDAFLDLPLSTQALYFHLCMRADDDGFINNPRKICRYIGASEDELKLLVAKRFCLVFDNGVIVIKHWRMHNSLRGDRHKPTQYQDLLETLEVKENKSYTEKNDDFGCQVVAERLPQYSIDKISLDKISIVESREEERSAEERNEVPSNPVCLSYEEQKMNYSWLYHTDDIHAEALQYAEKAKKMFDIGSLSVASTYADAAEWGGVRINRETYERIDEE